MNDHQSLKTAYTFFVGLLLAIFIGVGVQAFYPSPAFPEYPTDINYSENQSEEDKQKQKEYDEKFKQYEQKNKDYSRNVTIIVMSSAIALLSIGLLFDKRLKIIANGFIIGGILTLGYGIIRSFGSGNYKYTFAAVSIGLVIAMFLGYWQFVRPDRPTPTKSKSRKK